MTTFQIIAIVVLSLGTLASLGFLTASVVKMFSEEKIRLPKTEKVKAKVEPVVEEPQAEPVEEDTEIDIDQMLARLEARKAENEEQEQQEKPEVEVAAPDVKPAEETESTEEVVEEPVEEVATEEVVEPVEEVASEEVVEPVEETAKIEEPAEESVEETEEDEENEVVEEVEEKPEHTTIIINNINNGGDFDYKTRLEKIKESQDKIEKDLVKTKKAINKYERTQRRRVRNQKLLDRKAAELTNLNLVMYSVTDIKNIDVEKKAKQEELVAHIAELKASIQDAEEYLAKNESKYQNNVKLLSYLEKEKVRYEDEVKEIEEMIKKTAK